MRSSIIAAVDCADRLLAKVSLSAGDLPSLLIPMFHGIYPDRASAASCLFDPQQSITLSDVRQLLASFQHAGYRFVAPADIANGLAPDGKYVMLTFDDGYFNNMAVVPLLDEFHAPAVFFISTRHLQTGKAYWWDVLYREMTRSGRSASALRDARARCKSLRTAEVEDWLKAEFGLSNLRPLGDLDRPMTPAELKQLSNHRYAVIGNHTLDHAILTNYTPAEAFEQIAGAQQELLDMTGSAPDCIAYPNGNFTPEIVASAQRSGLTSGVVTIVGRNHVPVSEGVPAMTLKRVLPRGLRDIESQCRIFRSRLSIRSIAQSFRRGDKSRSWVGRK